MKRRKTIRATLKIAEMLLSSMPPLASQGISQSEKLTYSLKAGLNVLALSAFTYTYEMPQVFLMSQWCNKCLWCSQ